MPPSCPTRRVVSLLGLLLAGRASSAEPGPAPAAVLLTPSGISAFEYDGRTPGLPNPSCTVQVGEQARAAYAASLARLVLRADQPADLEFQVSVAAAGVEPAGSGGRVVVEHTLRLRAREGRELGSWRLRAEERIVGLDAEGVVLAFVRAARSNAAELERALAGSSELASWLGPRQPGPGGTAQAAPAERPATEPAVTPRGGWVVFLEPGVGFVSPMGESLPAVALRGGLSGRWFLVQAGGEYAGRELQGVAYETYGYAADLGGVYRVSPVMELRGGVGAQLLAVRDGIRHVNPPLPRTTARVTTASFFAGALFTSARAWTSLGLRGRAAFELRYRPAPEVRFPGYSGQPQRRLDLGSLVFGLALGFELPLAGDGS